MHSTESDASSASETSRGAIVRFTLDEPCVATVADRGDGVETCTITPVSTATRRSSEWISALDDSFVHLANLR
jgi:hypothetical protein